MRVRAVDLTHRTTAEAQIERTSGFGRAELSAMADKVSELMEGDDES